MTSAAETTGARFTADKLMIEPVIDRPRGSLAFVTRRGNDVVIAIDVANEGEEAATFTAGLVLDGEVIGWRDVKFAAGEQKQVRFRVNNVPKGTHWVSLAGFTGTFTSSQSINWRVVAAAGCAALCLGCLVAHRLKTRSLGSFLPLQR